MVDAPGGRARWRPRRVARRGTLGLGLAVGLGLAGCGVDAAPPPVTEGGSVVTRWSIDGSFDPDLCARSEADRFRITVFDATDAFVGEWIAPCRDFSTRIDLAPGRYHARAVLVGAAGDRTTVVTIAPFTVGPRRDTSVEIDFPRDSITAPTAPTSDTAVDE